MAMGRCTIMAIGRYVYHERFVYVPTCDFFKCYVMVEFVQIWLRNISALMLLRIWLMIT